MTAAAEALAPIPRLPGVPLLGSLPELRKARIPLQHRVAREHGDLVQMRVGIFSVLMASSPELAHEVLVTSADAFVKSHGLAIFARPLLGNGLLTSERDFHRRQRKLMSPAFVPARLEGYAEVMSERAERAVARMLAAGEVDMAEETMRVTLDIVGKTLFDAEIAEDASEVGDALTEAMERIMRALTGVVPIPPSLPTPGSFALRRAIARLDRVVYGIVRARRGDDVDRRDVLSILLAARDEDDGGRMDDVQIRDEAMTVVLAGHETTAAAVAWAMYLLAKHPDVRARVEAELDAVLGGRTPRFADLRALPYTLQVVKETMRLYPPAYVLGRRAVRDVTIGGHTVRKNQVVLVNVAGIHRHPRIWQDADAFDPDRFAPERERLLPRHAFMPFGAGARICIGMRFAEMEAHLLLATFCAKLRAELRDPSATVDVEPLVTLRPKGGVPMRVTAR